MKQPLLVFVIAALLLFSLTACDPLDPFRSEDGKAQSPAQAVADRVEPVIPNGAPRLLFDLFQSALAVAAGVLATRMSRRKLEAYDESEFDEAEAESMQAALDQLTQKKAIIAQLALQEKKAAQ